MDREARAGEGGTHVFRVVPSAETSALPFVPDEHYVGIEVVLWFVNGQSDFFRQRMVGGTMEATVNGRRFPVVLGRYKLAGRDVNEGSATRRFLAAIRAKFEPSGGQKIAPVVDRPIVRCLPYRGGDIVLQLVVQATEWHTKAGALLEHIAVATVLGVAGIVELEAADAAPPLVPATQALVRGAQEFLGSESPKKVDIFNPFTVTIHPTSELRGPKSYVLLHRGTDNLDGSQLCVRTGERGADVFYRNTPFRDGAWVLVRIRRPDTYMGDPRPWRDEYEQAKRALDDLFDSWKTGRLTLEQAKASLQRGTDVAPSVADRVDQVARRIRSDEALILADSRKYAGVLVAYLIAANEAIAANDPDRYKTVVSAIEDALRLNKPAPPALRDAITAELGSAPDTGLLGNCPPPGEVRFDDNVVGRNPP
jgi:hypothetical protein